MSPNGRVSHRWLIIGCSPLTVLALVVYMGSKSISSPVVSTLLPCSLFYMAVFYSCVVNVHSIRKKKPPGWGLCFSPLRGIFYIFYFPPFCSVHTGICTIFSACVCAFFFYACLFVRAYMRTLPTAGRKKGGECVFICRSLSGVLRIPQACAHILVHLHLKHDSCY